MFHHKHQCINALEIYQKSRPFDYALPDVVDVLGAVAAAEEVAHHRAHNLAVSVPSRLAAAAKILIYRTLNGLELTCHEVNSTERFDFLVFYLYICHILGLLGFCFVFAPHKLGEILDMAKSRELFVPQDVIMFVNLK